MPDEETRQSLLQRSSGDYAIATTLSRHNVILWNEWAMLYLTLGDLERAQEKVFHSLELDPDFDETWWRVQTSICAGQGLVTETIEAYERALEINPGKIDTWLLLGDTHMRQNQLEEAAEAYEQALELNPDHTQVWRALGSVYARLGRLDDATATLQRTPELAPEASDVWDIHRVMAIIYSQLGQNDVALYHAQMALELAPEDQQPAVGQLIQQLQQLTPPEG